MSTARFTTMSFPVSTLLGQIESGQIGLPELQRPFVWDRSQVRDLLDSMYAGYPAGFFLLWRANQDVGTARIGLGEKQTEANLLVVDGQQRLTSLFAVFKRQPVLNDRFEEVSIQIAFHPLRDKFEVANSATKNDPEWIDDISVLLSGEQGSYGLISDYIAGLGDANGVPDETKRRIAANIQRLESLNAYTFNAIELAHDLPIDEVGEIFVRVNSKGRHLDQADFILTLMSIHWDKGRKQLEDFSRATRKPSKSAGPFNWFIEPKPDQLLRVVVGLGHRRARLKYAYELLRGKDLETGEVSDANRAVNFATLEAAQEHVIDVTNFTEYLKSLQEAGFRSGKMVTSNNTILYSYLVFLVGRYDHGIDYPTLRHALARWFLMCVLTSRYTGSPESQVEKDLRRFAEAESGEQFLATLDQVIESQLSNDFWEITLPDQLSWSGGYVPAMFAYYAALNLLGARVLFSNMTVHELLEPTVVSKRQSIERHHLFPKGYLKTLGIKGTSRTNRVANYALVEWPHNAAIGDRAPSEYFPPLFEERVSPSEAEQVRFWHALPPNWEHLDYDTFLAERQKLMAKVIKAGYVRLSEGHSWAAADAVPELFESAAELIAAGESATVEFKSSLYHSYREGVPEKVISSAAVKTIAAFLNSDGGTLIIGVDDDQNVVGLEPDLRTKGFDLDRFENALTTLIMTAIDDLAVTRCRTRFETLGDRTVCLVDVERSPRPVYADTDKTKNVFFVRAGNTTRALETRDVVEYIKDRFGK